MDHYLYCSVHDGGDPAFPREDRRIMIMRSLVQIDSDFSSVVARISRVFLKESRFSPYFPSGGLGGCERKIAGTRYRLPSLVERQGFVKDWPVFHRFSLFTRGVNTHHMVIPRSIQTDTYFCLYIHVPEHTDLNITQRETYGRYT